MSNYKLPRKVLPFNPPSIISLMFMWMFVDYYDLNIAWFAVYATLWVLCLIGVLLDFRKTKEINLEKL